MLWTKLKTTGHS